MAETTETTQPPTPAVTPVVPAKKCPGCGHEVGNDHDKNCIYRGTVIDANAV